MDLIHESGRVLYTTHCPMKQDEDEDADILNTLMSLKLAAVFCVNKDFCDRDQKYICMKQGNRISLH